MVGLTPVVLRRDEDFDRIGEVGGVNALTFYYGACSSARTFNARDVSRWPRVRET